MQGPLQDLPVPDSWLSQQLWDCQYQDSVSLRLWRLDWNHSFAAMPGDFLPGVFAKLSAAQHPLAVAETVGLEVCTSVGNSTREGNARWG